jgi:hypothetical protein
MLGLIRSSWLSRFLGRRQNEVIKAGFGVDVTGHSSGICDYLKGETHNA